MPALIGIMLLIVSVASGYVLHGGRLDVLFQRSEILILCGAAVSYVIVAGGSGVSARLLRRVVRPRPRPDRHRYLELMEVFMGLLWIRARVGVRGLEAHLDAPGRSVFLRRFTALQADPGALALLSDTLRLAGTGQTDPGRLDELMEADIDQQYEFEMAPVRLLSRLADAMPAFGIVAAVLGVIVSMGQIGGDPVQVGRGIAAALVGTFLGVLLAYGLLAPLAHSMEERVEARMSFLHTIRAGVLAFARHDPPIIAVEHIRRAVPPECRPAFEDAERIARDSRPAGAAPLLPTERPHGGTSVRISA